MDIEIFDWAKSSGSGNVLLPNVIEGSYAEWNMLRSAFEHTQGLVSLSNVRAWAGLHNKTKPNTSRFRRFLKRHPMFETPCHYKYEGSEVYLTFEGFSLWIMTQRNMKMRVLQAKFADKISNGVSPQHLKRKRDPDRDDARKIRKIDFDGIDSPIEQSVKDAFRADPPLNEFAARIGQEKQNRKIVYFISEEGDPDHFKIGLTTQTIEKRIAQLQTGNRRKLVLYRSIPCADPHAFERHLHAAYKKLKIRGEWYKITSAEIDNLVDFITSA